MIPEPDPPRETTEALSRRLADLDAEIDRTRKRVWSIEKGLLQVTEPERELAELDARFHALADEFVATYRRWQDAERRGAAAPDSGGEAAEQDRPD